LGFASRAKRRKEIFAFAVPATFPSSRTAKFGNANPNRYFHPAFMESTAHAVTKSKVGMRNPIRIQTAVFALLMACTFAGTIRAQAPSDRALAHVRANAEKYGLSNRDLADIKVTDVVLSHAPEISHVYLRQAIGGIGIYKAEMNLALDAKGKVVVDFVSGVADAKQKANTSIPSISPQTALANAALHFKWAAPEGVELLLDDRTQDQSLLYSKGNLSQEDIPFRLVFVPIANGDLRLAWDFSVLQLDGKHWWSLKVDAVDGSLLEKLDWTSHCAFDHNHAAHSPLAPEACDAEAEAYLPLPPNSYNVFDLPIESPSYGARTIVTSPWNLTASPYGWHDTNGSNGAEYTITRGNNVLAQEDANGNNGTGYSPSGGATLNFDFPLNLNAAPLSYRDAALTNLFYWNNKVHDLWYLYGFDEQSGNFQQNNYGRGGTGSDYVLADGQDGSGTNNANFSTPPDGQQPRMQMYLWTGVPTNNFVVNSPSTVAGTYFSVSAGFGPSLPVTPITQNLVLVNDGSASPSLGCSAFTNAGAVNGKIALIDRGTCTFVNKVQFAQNAGAVACVVCNNVAGTPIVMGGTSGTINIPSVMISQSDCALLKAQLASGVNVSLSSPGVAFDRDGDLDNGVIAHEYGHGISNRLTGGPSNTNCLSNAEQMGEGWSDWFGLMMTIKPSDVGATSRGIGTYVVFEPTNGTGIRPAPYTTNMALNGYTYIDIQNTATISSPHGIGFLWCNMLWEMSWKLIDQYGYDPNLESGNGGNNIAMRLVMQGLKLQPCSPGFVTGRDAILDADTLLYGGQYSCLIWDAFAKRGLGVGASQGSANSRSDGSQSFVRPPCVVASFSAAATTVCQGGSIAFSDNTAGAPTAWSWNFGDGGTSTQQNPSHTFNTAGTFTVIMTATVSGNSNTQTRTGYITVYPSPTATASVSNATCGNSNGSLTATAATGQAPYTYAWSSGSTTATANGLAPGTYTLTVTDARGCTSTTPFTVNNAAGPVASISATTPASCGSPTGSATAAATGGTGNLNYAWSNGGTSATINNVAAGNYTVTVTDQNGCTSTAVASVSNSNGPSVAVNNPTPTSCGLNNGAATATSSGGTGNLTFSWSTGATTAAINNLAPGTYTVSVTDQNQCLAVNSVTIPGSSAPVASISSNSAATCGLNNGSLTASAANGTGPYTYLWGNGATTATINNLAGGNHVVTVTDAAGCTNSTSITLAAYSQPTVQVVPADLTCFNQNNGTATANPSGGLAPYTYYWNTGILAQQITGLPAALYFVTVTDANGCTVNGFCVVNQPIELQGFTSSTNESGVGAMDGTATAGASGGTTPYSYTWNNGGTTATITGLASGMYYCTIQDALGCTYLDSVEVGLTLVGIGASMENAIDVLPNPNTGSFEVRITLPVVQDVQVMLVNSLGQVLYSRNLDNLQEGILRLEGLDLSAGVYHLRVKGNEFQATKKVVVVD
jgi:hypothetical protein